MEIRESKADERVAFVRLAGGDAAARELLVNWLPGTAVFDTVDF